MIKRLTPLIAAVILVSGCLSTSDALSERGRSPKWPEVRDAHVRAYPYCALCGSEKKPEGHHIIPYSVDPGRELDPDNIVTLCRTGGSGCHFFAGHAGISWSHENSNLTAVLKYGTGRQLYEYRKEAKKNVHGTLQRRD